MKNRFRLFKTESQCWYCVNKAEGILTLQKGEEEVQACKVCAKIYGKIRRFKKWD